MNAYVFAAALLCEDCAEKFMADPGNKPEHVDPDDESSYDSNDWPKGPYSDGGGEADSPQHCDHCDEFLDNPLTTEGEGYVFEAFEQHVVSGAGDFETLRTWRMAYPWVWENYSTDYAKQQARFDRLD